MTTLSDLIERTRRHLMSETRDERNRLNGAATAGATSLTMEFDAEGIQAGAALAVELEEFHVWQVADKTVTVSGAQGGSTAAAHADGSHVFVNPKFSAFGILGAVNEELADLSSPVNGLFKVATVAVAYDAGTAAYDLEDVTDLIDILDVTYEANDGYEQHPRLRGWSLKRDMPVADFPSGLALTVTGYAEPGQNLNVAYKTGFTALSSLAQDVEAIAGLPVSAHDIVPLGAAVRLLAGTEVARNFLDQGDTRRAQEVQPYARSNQMRALVALRRERISAEKARLYAQYPVRRG